MREIKIFIASSEELKHERLLFSEMELKLNNKLRSENFHLEIEMWEHCDSSMSPLKHKQEEYNDVLRESEMCIVVFWKKLGGYTKYEFETAMSEFEKGNNPKKVYIYFKETEEMTDDLKSFKKIRMEENPNIIFSFSHDAELRSLFYKHIEDYCNVSFL